jgi:hypothetical protein
MKYITTFLKKFLPKELPTPVGRWSIEKCDKKMNNKIDLSNEDHCGPCGQYALTKTDLTPLDIPNTDLKGRHF